MLEFVGFSLCFRRSATRLRRVRLRHAPCSMEASARRFRVVLVRPERPGKVPIDRNEELLLDFHRSSAGSKASDENSVLRRHFPNFTEMKF